VSAHHPLHDIAVVGVGMTPQARRLETDSLTASIHAAKAALADAGIDHSEVDGICALCPGYGCTVF